jgi:tRNA ligase
MATTIKTPYAEQDVSEISQLVKSLESAAKRGNRGGGFTCKKATFEIPDANGLELQSWRFMDWDYKRDDLPTYARGLFTYKRLDNTHEIAIRGYDKFFNVGEVNDTQWPSVQSNTVGPYELSVKENGCIIFISGLEGDHLLVCSKHSTGARQDTDVSHALAGERWVEKHLAAVGKTKTDLARELRKRNATAVYELCDDSFEEHVLGYDEKTAGLYLHGINLNLPEFTTYPGPLVHEFADIWGFKKAEFLIKDDIDTVKKFLDGCAETGSWNGRDTEGFVIRCRKQERGMEVPYADWFFKYKFEEPYLMYRQWREATKAVIAGRVPKYKKHKKITEEYLLFARRRLAADKNLGKAYMKNHGIIKLRDDFLKERGLKGSDIIREYGEGDTAGNVTENVILVPIATIGCGKTTLALALVKLFDWGHVQNDNITGQKGRPKQFVTQLCNNMAAHPVVIADRNNHQKRERKQLIEDVSRIVPTARYVALHYVHEPKQQRLPKIREVTRARVEARGDNHQTIQVGSKGMSEVEHIMEGFLQRFEALQEDTEPDNAFDEIINLDPVEDSRHNLEIVVNSLRHAYPKLIPEMPSPDVLDAAIAAAMNEYTPDIKHNLSFSSKNKDKSQSPSVTHNVRNTTPKQQKIEYFCLRLPASQVLSALSTTFAPLPPAISRFYHTLQQTRRIQPGFHVTLIHRASTSNPAHKPIWDRLSNLHASAQASQPGQQDPLLGKSRVLLERIVWDERLMCIVARILDEGWECVNRYAHVTIGTREAGIKPKESNDLLERWEKEKADGEGAKGEASAIQEFRNREGWEVWGEARAVVPNTRG